MINRRSFLSLAGFSGLSFPSTVLSANNAQPASFPPSNDFEQALAKAPSLDLLGRPQCWSLVRDCIHPISPERVIVMTHNGGDGYLRLESSQRETWQKESTLPAEKMNVICRLMQVMTDYSMASTSFSQWVTKLIQREALGTTGIGYGFGLLHQFQDDGYVELHNPPVDWWLILFPEGIEWDALDGEPVYGMLGHVFPASFYPAPGLALRVWELACRVARNLCNSMGKDAWRRIARLDRVASAQVVNRAVVNAL